MNDRLERALLVVCAVETGAFQKRAGVIGGSSVYFLSRGRFGSPPVADGARRVENRNSDSRWVSLSGGREVHWRAAMICKLQKSHIHVGARS
jgi:hypothetical protein